MKKSSLLLSSLVSMLSAALFPLQVQAAINNPALNPELGGTRDSADAAMSGSVFTSYFVTIWRGIVFVGGIMVLIYFLWGAIEWITAAGDSGKVGKARDKITQAVIGLILLIGSFAIIGFISTLFFGSDFNLLNLTIPTPEGFAPGT